MAHYWPYYCEENVWWLACDLHSQAGAAIFISGAEDRVVMAAQRAGAPPHGVLCWDYHVVLMRWRETAWEIVDPDCTAPEAAEGLRLDEYARISFPALTDRWAHCAPRFRIVDAPTFTSTFASDRRHMRDDQGGWLEPPPPWPCVGTGHSLDSFRAMSADHGNDTISLAELLRRYGD